MFSLGLSSWRAKLPDRGWQCARSSRGAGTVIERRLLGVVDVDSGTLLVGDPTYLLAQRSRGKEGADYEEVIRADASLIGSPLGDRPVLLIQGFGGDGTFPVFGEFEDGAFLRLVVDFDAAADED
jgi:hypothetical protein